MLEAFKENRFNRKNRGWIDTANAIVSKYQALGLRLTVRQIYYQFVALHGLPNTYQNYKSLAHTLSEARLCGLIDWDAIEDRGRVPHIPLDWESPADILQTAAKSYRLPRWAGQESYAEIWVEKSALAGVLEPLASEFHVPLSVNRGYNSQSAMYEASKRFMFPGNEAGETFLFYIGDHDPSGEDMVRDISERMEMFGCTDLQVEKIALTTSQVKKYKPPPNPAKMKDSRALQYVVKHGTNCWEVDALDPQVLQDLIREALEGIINRKVMDPIIARETKQRAQLDKLSKNKRLKWAK